MKTILIKTLLVLFPVLFISNTERKISHSDVSDMIRQRQVDSVNFQLRLYESGIELNLSEIQLLRQQKEKPFKVLPNKK